MQHKNENIKWDCSHYNGSKPCKENQLCGGCSSYEPHAERICIIKLGAFGDVIRTTALLPSLHEKYPNAHITWVTKPNAARLLDNHKQINRLITFDAVNAFALLSEAFDVVICLDKEPGPCALAMQLKTKIRLGVGLSEVGTPIPINKEAESYFYLGLSDDLKFHDNQKDYSQLIHDALGLSYTREPYHLDVDETAHTKVAERLKAMNWIPERHTVGINVGAGNVFANKSWTTYQLSQYIQALHNTAPNMQIMLLGGPPEQQRMDDLHEARPYTIHTDYENTEHEFLALIDHCDILFTGDTMAMHLAIARNKGVIAFFGPTCHQEIDLFDRGEKLIATPSCAPCYKRVCNQQDVCLEEITIEQAVAATLRVLKSATCHTQTFTLPQYSTLHKAS